MKKTITFLAIAFCLNTNAQNLCFSAATNYTVGTNAYSITSADFNGDGKKDLATANQNSNNVSINLGTGAGNFGAATNFAVGSSPSCVASADFNGDGKPDLATANGNSANISVLLGTGTGSFGAASSIAVGGTFSVPWSIISMDFNGDGKKDLAVGYSPFSGAAAVAVLLGTGSGSFGAATNFTTTSTGAPWGIISADFNGDTKLDLATANYGADNISILLGTGTGSFGAPTNFAAGIQPISILTADFNGDAKLDLATANYDNSNNLSVFLGTGTGSFGTATNISISNYATSITSADYNADGKADLAVTSDAAYVLLGIGTGSFGTATSFNVGSGPYSIVSADLNGDGKIDLATANSASNNASVLLNCAAAGIATFSNEQEINIYPNPSNGSFIIETNTTEKQTVTIYDVNGKVVLSTAVTGTATIDASNLPGGVYSVNITNSNGAVNKKVVIVK